MRHSILLLLILILTACRSKTPPLAPINKIVPYTSWQAHQAQLSSITKFETSGSLSYFSPQQRFQVRFHLKQHSPQQYQLRFSTVLGGNIFILNSTPEYAQLITSTGKIYRATDAKKLLFQFNQIALPLDTIGRWIVGLSDKNQQFKLDKAQRLARLRYQQPGELAWHIHYPLYQLQKEMYLPKKIILQQRDSTTIKLNFTAWQLL